MACTCAPALITARNELNACWPNRDRGSDGCCGDAAHRARKSDHNPRTSGAAKGFAAAYDYDEDIASGLGDRELTGFGLILLADPRTKMLIYEAEALYPDGTVRPYTGVNAHKSHLHHSIHDWAVHDTSPWNIAAAFALPVEPPDPSEEDDDMKDLVFISPNGQIALLRGDRFTAITAEMSWQLVKVDDKAKVDERKRCSKTDWANLVKQYGEPVG